MDRQHRKELKHDRFVDELGTLSARARANQRLLVTVTAAALALALLGYGIYFYHSNRETQAQEALGKAIDTIQSPLLPAAGGQAMPGAKYKTDQEKMSVAETQFRDVAKKYSGSDAGDVADLYLARIEAMKGNTSDAQVKLQKFVEDHPKSILVGAARFSLYSLRIDGGQSQQVINELQTQIAKPADSVLPADTMLILLAHAYDAQGNADKSKDAYRRIVTEFPDSPYAVEAQRKAGPA
jgi:TolA-binding protein